MLQYWWVKHELEFTVEVFEPKGKFIYHHAWWCDYCGDTWARVATTSINQPLSGSGQRWRLFYRRCSTHGRGDLLDHAIISQIEPQEIPPAIYARELQHEVKKYEHASTAC